MREYTTQPTTDGQTISWDDVYRIASAIDRGPSADGAVEWLIDQEARLTPRSARHKLKKKYGPGYSWAIRDLKRQPPALLDPTGRRQINVARKTYKVLSDCSGSLADRRTESWMYRMDENAERKMIGWIDARSKSKR